MSSRISTQILDAIVQYEGWEILFWVQNSVNDTSGIIKQYNTLNLIQLVGIFFITVESFVWKF
jgi:hypothetical protein